MLGLDFFFKDLQASESNELHFCKDLDSIYFVKGGLFLEPAVPSSFVSFLSTDNASSSSSFSSSLSCTWKRRRAAGGFLSVGLSIKGNGKGLVQESDGFLVQNGERRAEEETVALEEDKKRREIILQGGGRALNTTKHLWAGAVAAMVSRRWYWHEDEGLVQEWI